MRWQPMVSVVRLLVSIVLLAALNGVNAGSDLPALPAMDSRQNTDDMQRRPCRFTGDFKQERNLEELDSPLVSTGRFLFSCKKGLLWEVRKPIVDSRVYSTKKLNFRVRKNARVTQVKSIAVSRTAKMLLDFLGGDTAALAKDFEWIKDADSPERLVLVPKKKSVRKRLTQLVIQQRSDTIRITIQAPDKGDVVIVIKNIAIFEEDEIVACRQFSQQPRTNCAVLIKPADFIASQSELD